uniref:Uncharacterized protein n=1 Tax=Anas platyrhynchos TaxID=8839 RepID=A0A8B9SYL1_ANAPL
MVEQQILIDQLKEKLEKLMVVKTWDFSSACGDGPAVTASARRPYSVPLLKSMLHSLYPSSGTETGKVYTSPPAFSLARMMAGFRARSQMILSYIEDQDEVLHCHLSDQSDEEKENTDSQKHSINQRWTRKQASPCFPFEQSDMKCQVDKSSLCDKSVPQTDTATGEEIDCLQKSHVFNMQKLKNSELRLTEAKQKMRELALHIKMKEELIKELVRTGKDAECVSRQYSLKITKPEQESEQAKMELAETEKQLQELENKELRELPEKAKLQKEFRKKMDAAKLKVQELQLKMEQQQKILKLKDREIAAFKKKKNNSVGTLQKSEVANLFQICVDTEKKGVFIHPVSSL